MWMCSPSDLCSILVCMVALRVPAPSADWLVGRLQQLLAAAPAMMLQDAAGLERLRNVAAAVRALDDARVSRGAVAESFSSALALTASATLGHAPAAGTVPPAHKLRVPGSGGDGAAKRWRGSGSRRAAMGAAL